MVAGAEFGPDSDAFESGLGFAVDFKKKDFIGRAALERNATAPRRKLVGLTFPGSEAPHHGDRIFAGREQGRCRYKRNLLAGTGMRDRDGQDRSRKCSGRRHS